MSYILKEHRGEIEEQVEKLACEIENEGELNFAITRLIIHYVKKVGVCYATVNTVVGVLTCVMNEYYRRVIVPYERKSDESPQNVLLL